MRRRDALKTIGALAGAGAASRFLTGCGTGQIQTVVAVVMENRSYDHYFGARTLLEDRPGDGLVEGMGNPDVDGSPVAIYRETDYCVADPPHGWQSSHSQFNDGANDGFLGAYHAAHPETKNILPYVMGYFGREDIPFSWAIADQYASCDRWFCSVMGPTWPNREFFHSGQSGGFMSNTGAPFTWPTVYHQLSAAGIPWAYYYSDLPFLLLWEEVPDPKKNLKSLMDFFADAAAGTLPPFTVVEPGFQLNDDHPPKHPILGQAFLASVYAALAGSPQWNECLLVVTYDEHGGFFDHVAPPLAADDRADLGFRQLGFRVPTMAAGPYVKQGHVSSVVRDHTSIIKHLCGMFGLEPLTARVAGAEDLSELIDEDRLDAFAPARPAEMPAIEVDESKIEPECRDAKSFGHEPNDLVVLAERGFFPPEFDLRSQRRDMFFAIGDELDRLNAGRIRRGR